MRRLPSSTRNPDPRRPLTLTRGTAKSRSVDRSDRVPNNPYKETIITHNSQTTFHRPIGSVQRLASPIGDPIRRRSQRYRSDSCDVVDTNKIGMSLKIYHTEILRLRNNFDELQRAMNEFKTGLDQWEAHILDLMAKQPGRCVDLPLPETFDRSSREMALPPARIDNLWMGNSNEVSMTQPDERRHIRRASVGNSGRPGRGGDLTEADKKRYHLEQARRLLAENSAAAAARKLFEEAGVAAVAEINSSGSDDRERTRLCDVQPVDAPPANLVSRRLTASNRLPASTTLRKDSCEVSARQKLAPTNEVPTRSNRSETAADENAKVKENTNRTRWPPLETTRDDDGPDSLPPESARSDGLNSTFSNAEDICFPSNPIGSMRKPLNVPTLGLDTTKLQPAAWLSGQPTQGDVYK